MEHSAECKNRAISMLVVDDDDVFRERLVRALRERGFQVCAARSAAEAVELAVHVEPSHALLDLGMSHSTARQVLDALRALRRDARIVIFTGFGSALSAGDAVSSGADSFLSKPADVDEIIAAFERTRAPVAA